MGLFQEYMNSKGKVEKAKVDISGDRVDPMTPPNAPKGGKPYGVKGSNPKGSKEKGFGDQGDSSLKYQPKVDNSKGAEPAKIPTAEQAELCSVVVDALKKDSTIAEQLVGQIKQSGILSILVAEMLQYKETYQHIAEVMGHREYGPGVCGRLVRAMNEEVAPPFAASLEGEETEEDEEPENEFAGSEEGIDDGEVAEVDAAMADDTSAQMDGIAGNPMPVAANPLMQPQPPAMMPPPAMPQPPAMKNFQMAMMHRR